MTRNIIRWCLTVSLIVLALLYLNSTGASFWAAGGPPTKYPRAWEQRGISHFCYSIASMVTAVMLYIGLKNNYNWKKSKLKYIWVILLLLSLGYPKARESMLIDKCLDSGGKWNYEYFECNK